MTAAPKTLLAHQTVAEGMYALRQHKINSLPVIDTIDSTRLSRHPRHLMTPEITVILPAFNAQQFLARAIKSVQESKFRKLGIVDH